MEGIIYGAIFEENNADGRIGLSPVLSSELDTANLAVLFEYGRSLTPIGGAAFYV